MKKLLKNKPKRIPRGYALVMHLAPSEYELVTFPATKTKPERQRWCHKILGYSIKKSEWKPWVMKSESEIIKEIRKEIKNAK